MVGIGLRLGVNIYDGSEVLSPYLTLPLFFLLFFSSEGTENKEEEPVTTPLLEHMKQKYLTREAKSVCVGIISVFRVVLD